MSEASIIHNSFDRFFREPFGAVPCNTEVTLRILVTPDFDGVWLRYSRDGEEEKDLPMALIKQNDWEKVYEIKVKMPSQPGLVWYYFFLKGEEEGKYYGNNMQSFGGLGKAYAHVPPSYQITVYKEGAATPDWFKESIIYQIFVDRFFNGCADGKILGTKKDALLHLNWYDNPIYLSDHKDKSGRVAKWSFFGGNLLGVQKKLSYLKSLGINVIYFNPIFESPSNHKYDTGDYHKVDPMYGDNELFQELCREAKELGIEIILDGVFSHTGSDSIYFNKEGNYPSLGAYQSPDSPYYKWYSFLTCNEYECWWQIDTLPNVNELEPSYQRFIIYDENSVLKYWMKKGAKGWRLDVVDELPDQFIKNFSKTLKEVDSQAVLIGEVWEDATNKISYSKRREYLLGEEVDSVMNYPFRNILLDFITGKRDASVTGHALMNLYENYPLHHFYSAMNLIDSHDVPRALTVIKDSLPKEWSEEYSHAIAIAKLKLTVLLQMTFPGVPSIYYGDEAGLEGGEDPHNRKTYPWGREDKNLLSYYKKLTALRNHYDVLKTGKWINLEMHGDIFGFLRIIEKGKDIFGQKKVSNIALIIVNRSEKHETVISLDLSKWSIEKMVDTLDNYTEIPLEKGRLNIALKPLQARLLVADRWGSNTNSKREAGILLHPTSFPSSYGMGDIGKEAYRFIDFLAESKQSLWQILPLNPPGFGGSPYQCVSAFAGNPFLIDIEDLLNRGLIKEDSVVNTQIKEAWAFKEALLKEAFETFKKRQAKEEYFKFIENNDFWLEDYALYAALKEHFHGVSWSKWEKSIAERQEVALAHYKKLLAADIEYNKFVQYIFFSQWKKLKNYANSKGIKIIGDMPIFVAHDSSDVWVNREYFELDELGNPAKVAGVPPDYFSEYGQRWGNPLYKWEKMQANDYKWWRERFNVLYQLVDIIRIDHFRGFEQYWEIPASEATAVNGKWVKGPGEHFFCTIKKYLGNIPLIAEDLGLLTEGVEELRIKFGLPGMKILHFEIESGRLNLPINEKLTVLYTGSHDNDTTVGWYKSQKIKNTQELLTNEDIAWHFIEMAYQSDAETVIIPLQDVLALDTQARMNTPGTTDGNWQWRYEKDMLTENIKERLINLTAKYHR